jgi:hypothetical protein
LLLRRIAGDLVFAKSGELIGMMVNKEYCAQLTSFVSFSTIPTGANLDSQAIGTRLSWSDTFSLSTRGFEQEFTEKTEGERDTSVGSLDDRIWKEDWRFSRFPLCLGGAVFIIPEERDESGIYQKSGTNFGLF